jgi:hypothetical protein
MTTILICSICTVVGLVVGICLGWSVGLKLLYDYKRSVK